MTQQTVWDLFSSRKLRLGVLLLIGGILGVALMGWILRVPLGVSLLVALFIGGWGVTAAFLEMIVKAVANSRAKITFRAREPYEFLRLSKGYLNVAHITYVHCNESGSLVVAQSDDATLTLEGEDAEKFATYLNEIATPLWAMGASEEA